MANDDLDSRQRGNPADAARKPRATGASYSPPFNRPEELREGDHLPQYGMRSVTPHEEPAQLGSTEPFEEEFQIREARDHRPRTIPTGLTNEPTTTSAHAGEKTTSPSEPPSIPATLPDPARK